MKLEPTSYYVNNVVPLKDSVKEFLRLKNPEESQKSSRCRIQGGALSDIRYSWLCRGPKLEVLHTKTGSKVAAWSFGSVVHDFETFVTCVTELPSVQGKLPLLIIGLECEISGGMICMFDINSSRVIRAIQIDDRVAAIHVVNPGCDTSFPGALRAMDGVLAVGTGKGKIVLIDLCRQICEEAVVNVGPEYVRDEVNACHLTYLSFFDLDHLEVHKERSLNSGDHLALQINEPSTSGVHFALHGPNGEVRLHANMEEVAISALHYCPQLGSLLVGFNFGAFQIYNLLNIQLEYTSPVYEDCIPITHFAIQEPCDDPRAFCYVWVVYNILENGDSGFPMAVMYALAYDAKDFLEGYGYLYQEFNSCSVRFQIELSAVPGFRLFANKNSACTGARCISLNAYTKSVVNRQYGNIQDVHDDKLALCSIVWIAWNQNLNSSEIYLGLFDLNQWYKEQMPSSTRLENDALSYMSCESLSELFGLSSEDALNSNLLDVRLDRSSLSPFVCPQRLEEHYYPTALSFQAICVQDANIIWLGNYGVQRHLLTQLEQAGPLRLLRPSDLFHRCISLGLTPLYTDVLYSVSTPLNLQREMILSVALEHQLVRWLCHCARDWSNGSQSMAGCTLDMLLDWAWKRANTLKFQSDKLCVPLFDHMGMRLDSNALLQLNHCTCQIKHLATLFETVVVKCTNFLNEQDVEDIKYQWKALQMISTYLEVLQWLLNVGLLPECPLSMYPRPDESEKMSAPFPAESLARFYEARRADLQTESDNKNRLIEGLTSRELLFIDNLIDIECNGNILHNQWECDGGNGLYPPPSLQAVLRAYLIEDIDIVHKHCLLIYLFLDLAMTLDQSRYKPIITHLIKFPAVFKLTPSVIKITQAFWQLDHGDFSTAMTQLLDPSINNEDLKPWHHRIVLKALLLQGQHQHALLYQQVRKPPVSSIQDICIIITLLIVNDLLQEAFHFQRCNRSHFNEKEILKHFFNICDKMNQQASVLHLPLCPIEEREFISYLKSNQNENNKNFLVIYYLQRDRYGEAFETNDYLNNNEILKQGLIGQQDRDFRNAIVSGFKKTLPEVTQQLLDYCKKEKEKIVSTANVSRPVPMSVYVHDSKGRTKYKSTLIQASFQKAKELWSTKLQSPNIENHLNNTPFISTPKMFRFSAERKDSSIIYPAILDSSNMETCGIDEGVTPAKRMKLSPRRSINDSQRLEQFKKRLSCYNSDSLLSTPIVKRRSIRSASRNSEDSVVIGTPTSILKVRPFLRNSVSPLRETSTTPEILEDNDSTSKPKTKPSKRTSFGISPRKPMVRTPRPVVHFEERSHSQSSNESERDQGTQIQIQIDVHREQTPETSSAVIDSKNSSRSTDDVFYSPNSSFNSSNNTNQSKEQEVSNSTDESSRRSSLKRKANDSISSRRSYKPLTPVTNIQNTSVRESLRSRKSNIEAEKPELIETNIQISVSEPPPEALEGPETTKSSLNTRLQSRQSTRNEATPGALTSKTVQSRQSLITKNDATPGAPTSKTVQSRQSTKNEATPGEPTSKSEITTRLQSRQSLATKNEATPKSEISTRSRQSSIAKPEAPSPKIVPKVSGRRSLSRQVLENNLFTKVVTTPSPSPRMNTRLSLTKLTDSDKKKGVEVLYSKSTTSIVKTISADKIEEKCDIKVLEKKDEFSSEKTDDTSAQIIKHVHNEIETKSNVTKVTEILDDSDVASTPEEEEEQEQKGQEQKEQEQKELKQKELKQKELKQKELKQKEQEESHFEEMNVLSFNSDISESEVSHFYQNSPRPENRYSVLLLTPDSDKNTREIDEPHNQEEIDEKDKTSDDDDDDKIEENMVEATEFQQDEEILDDEVDETSEEEKMSDQDEEDELNIYDDLPEDKPEDEPEENMDYDELNSEKSEEEAIPEQPESSASSSSEDSSQSSDVIMIKSSSNEDQSQSSSSSSDKDELIQENEDSDGGDEQFKDNETTSGESEDFNTNLNDELVQVESVNEDNNESKSNNTSEDNFKLTLEESAGEEEEGNGSIEEEEDENLNESIEEVENLNESIEEEVENLNESIEEEEVENLNEPIEEEGEVENLNEPIEEVEKEENKLNLNESAEEDETEKEEEQNEEVENAEIMEDINEDNMDKNNEFFINEDIEEMENVEFITEKSNDSETTKQKTLVEIHEEEAATAESQEKESNIIELLESSIVAEKENLTLNESEEVNPLEMNVIEISDTTIKPQENEEQNVIEISESTIKDEETSPNLLETNIIEISESTIKSHENEESTIQNEEESTIQNEEEAEVTVNPLEQNVIEISESTIKHQETEEMDTSSANPQNVIETIKPNEKELDIPARRTRSASQHSETKKAEPPKTPTRSSTRRRSIDHKIEEEPKEKPAKRITRSASVDKPLEDVEETSKSRTRKKSTDEAPRKTRASSVINLEVIEEDKPMSRTRRATSVDPKPEENPRQRRGQSLEPEPTKRGRKRTLQTEVIQEELQTIPEKIEEYSSTHRLTRHQKSIMEKSLVNQQKSRLQKLKEVEQIDPINLLDKESFTGIPDKEEGTYRAISPASSVSTQSSAALAEHVSPSTPKRRRGRPSLSETPESSTNTDSAQGRPRRRSFTQAREVIAATTPTRTRRSSRTSHDQDDAASVVSLSSVRSVPVVELKQLTEKDLVRHRSLSPTALAEDTGKSRRRSTRTSILPTKLTKISEETNPESSDEKPRRGRHRKTEGSSSQSDLSNRNSGFRRSSYKPLANYLPEHTVVKTRKSIKIRKFPRGGSSP